MEEDLSQPRNRGKVLVLPQVIWQTSLTPSGRPHFLLGMEGGGIGEGGGARGGEEEKTEIGT